MYRRLIAPGLLLLLAACAQDPSLTSNTVRICDDTGCSDRPKDQVSIKKGRFGRPGKPAHRCVEADREDPAEGRLRPWPALFPRRRRASGQLPGTQVDARRRRAWRPAGAEGARQFLPVRPRGNGPDAREAEKWLSIAAGRGDKESKKLLDPRKAKKEDEEDWKWRTEWRDRYYGYWYSGYPYYGVWQQTYWYY